MSGVVTVSPIGAVFLSEVLISFIPLSVIRRKAHTLSPVCSVSILPQKGCCIAVQLRDASRCNSCAEYQMPGIHAHLMPPKSFKREYRPCSFTWAVFAYMVQKILRISQAVRHRTLTPCIMGSSPISSTSKSPKEVRTIANVVKSALRLSRMACKAFQVHKQYNYTINRTSALKRILGACMAVR